MNTETAIISPADTAAIELVTNSLTSEHSKRAYTKALTDFLTWRNGRPINKALVQEYRQTLTGSPASINLKMSAIRKLATGSRRQWPAGPDHSERSKPRAWCDFPRCKVRELVDKEPGTKDPDSSPAHRRKR